MSIFTVEIYEVGLFIKRNGEDVLFLEGGANLKQYGNYIFSSCCKVCILQSFCKHCP